MTRPLVAAIVLTGFLTITTPAQAANSCPDGTSQAVTAESTSNIITLGAQSTSAGACGSPGDTDSLPVDPVRDSDLDAACVRDAISLEVDPFERCDLSSTTGENAGPTPGLIAAAFQRIPLPEAQLMIQPPKGRTLVNFETNFYTEQDEFTRTVTLLGRQVELRIWPSSFRWRFGDGEVRETTSPGSAYPDLEITHSYGKRGRVSPSVDATYAAEFRVDGGPWREVTGTVTIPGSPQSLRVVTARPVLVGG